MFRLLSKLPPYDQEYEHQGTLWGEKIIEKLRSDVRKTPNELLRFVSTTMLIIAPSARHGAQECYDEASRLSFASGAAPPPIPHEDEATLGNDGPQTAILRDTMAPLDPADSDPIRTADIIGYIIASVESSKRIDSAEMQRNIRSKNPSPNSHRRRSGRVMKSSTHCNRRLAVQTSSQKRAEANSGIGHCEDTPDKFLPASWGRVSPCSQPQGALGIDPDLVAEGMGYMHEECPFNAGRGRAWGARRRSWGAGGRSWGAGGRSWGAGRSWIVKSPPGDGGLQDGKDPADQEVDDDDTAVARALLLAIEGDD